MKICYLDAFSGISGDMTVGALVDAGADQARLLDMLEGLGTGARLHFETVKRRGFRATKFVVELPPEQNHGHRHLPEVLELLERSSLPSRVKEMAAAVFHTLARAEAAVHGIPVEKVHFHEVGAVDSIVDIAGAAAGFYLLGVDRIYCSPVNLGTGSVRTQHGVLPVPAPATAELLRGKPVYASGPALELTTPTGAAIAVTLAEAFGPLPPIQIEAIGYGAGTKELDDRPNVLRVIVGQASGATEAIQVAVIETNIDDASPELLAHATEQLMAAGALDVSLSPLIMKKGRPGVLLRVIAPLERREELAARLLEETTTFGVRMYSAERRVKARQLVEVETRYGTARVKVASDGSFSPEFEDCRRLALEKGVPVKQILTEVSCRYWEQHRKLESNSDR